MAARRQSTTGTGARTVWRFVDYAGRFGAEEALKQFKAQCVPKYLQWHINAWDGYGGAVMTAKDRLKAEKNFIWLQGAVVELLTVATNTHPEYQGYLLTSRMEPMEASEVGSILRVDGRKARAVLIRLKAVGFLEEVPWPLSSPAAPIPDDPSLRLLQDVAKAGKKAAGKRGEKGRYRGENADDAFRKGRRSERLAAQANLEVTAAAETPPGQAAQTAEATEARKLVCPNCGHKGEAPKAVTKAGQCSQCGTLVPAMNGPTSTTSTNPDGRAGLAHGDIRGASPHAGPPSVIRLQEVRETAIEPHKYSTSGNEFGQRVCDAYGFVAHEGGEYVNEVAHWAKLYDEELVTLSDFAQRKVKDKVLRIAGEVRTGKRRPECPGSYVQRVMQNAIRDCRRRTNAKIG